MAGPESLPGAVPDRIERAARTKRARSGSAILDAAEGLFERDGYAGTTVAAIAESAGVGLATLYSHHTTKAALADEVFRRRLDDEPDPAEAAEDRGGARADHRLRALLDRLARTAVRAPGAAEAVLQATSGPPTRAQRSLDSGSRGSIPGQTQVAETLRAGQGTGHFRADVDADEVARMLVTTVLDQIVADPQRDPAAVAQRVASWILLGITDRGGTPRG